MAEGSDLALGRGHATICLPFGENEYEAIVDNPKQFREGLDGCFAEMPELFRDFSLIPTVVSGVVALVCGGLAGVWVWLAGDRL